MQLLFMIRIAIILIIQTLATEQLKCINDKLYVQRVHLKQKALILKQSLKGLKQLVNIYNKDRTDKKNMNIVSVQHKILLDQIMYSSITRKLSKRWHCNKYYLNDGKYKFRKKGIYKPSNDLFQAIMTEQTLYQGNQSVIHLIDKSIYVAMEPGCERYINKTNNLFGNHNMRYNLEI